MRPISSQITNLAIVYSTVYSGADQGKHQSSSSLAFVRGSYRWPANSPHKGLVTRKMFSFDNVVMTLTKLIGIYHHGVSWVLRRSKSPIIEMLIQQNSTKSIVLSLKAAWFCLMQLMPVPNVRNIWKQVVTFSYRWHTIHAIDTFLACCTRFLISIRWDSLGEL